MSIHNPAQLVIIEPGGTPNCFTLLNDQYTIGRFGGANDLGLTAKFVSSQHGMFNKSNGTYYYIDLASLNGTFINGKKIQGQNGTPTKPVALKDGDILSIGAPNTSNKVFILFSDTTNDRFEWKTQYISSKPEITIGRDENSDIVVPNITVSRNHAVIKANSAGVFVTDLKSANGTILNNQTITSSAQFNNNDVIKIGPTTKIIRIDNQILYSVPKPADYSQPAYTDTNSAYGGGNTQNAWQQGANNGFNTNKPPVNKPTPNFVGQFAPPQGGVQLRVDNISRIVPCKAGTGINGSNKKYILQNVSLTINPGELVAILGGSGAGKTTFMNAVNGFEPATEGTVYINNTELYKNYQSLKSNIGYVPQQDIVHDDLTLEDMLTYTGKLRLPRDVSKEELKRRVAQVMEMVELTPQKDTFIKKLSGGQRKRASIAVELISDPSLFFLDEPTSGLDPEAETNLMHQLQNLSKTGGKTVIVITHTLQNIRLFDKVVFLAPGGKLCFYGTPDEAKQFFGVDNLVDAYEIILKDIDGTVARYNATIANKGGMM